MLPECNLIYYIYTLFERRGSMNVVENETMEELIISNEDFEKYFNKRKWITREEYEKYLQIKLDN